MRRLVCAVRTFGRHDEAELGVRSLARGRRRILMLAACIRCGRVRARFPGSQEDLRRAAQLTEGG